MDVSLAERSKCFIGDQRISFTTKCLHLRKPHNLALKM
jgi:hypothetical protein